ncbi:MAG: hypothetical protein V1754_06570 [Pseudomonadota bacterium]
MVSLSRWLAVMAFLLTSQVSFAARDLWGTRSVGMGGAVRATATGATAILSNPAGLSLAKMYVVDAIYQHRFSDAANLFHASIIDSVTQVVAAGISYSFASSSPTQTLALEKGGMQKLEESTYSHAVGLSLSYPLGQMLHIGLSGHYVNYQSEFAQEVPGPLQAIELNNVAINAGAILRLFSALSFGIVGSNLVPIHDQLYPQTLGLGIAFQAGTVFAAEFDSVFDFTSDPEKMTVNFHGGAEVFLAKQFILRAGAMYDMFRDATYASGGIGTIIQRFALEVGLRQMIDGGAETQLAVSVQLFVQ